MEEVVNHDMDVAETTEVTQPIIIDLGKQKKKRIKQLKRGEGKLWDEVLGVLDEVQVSLGDEASGKTLVPVIMIYRQKKKRKSPNLLFPFAQS